MFSIPTVIMEIFNVIVEFAIPNGIPTKKVKEEIETHPVTVEAEISR